MIDQVSNVAHGPHFLKSFAISMQNLPYFFLKHGLWTLKDNLLEALGINAEKFEQFLKNQGFFSFRK